MKIDLFVLCKGETCRIRENCQRYTAKQNFNKVWYWVDPYDQKKRSCQSFYPTVKK